MNTGDHNPEYDGRTVFLPDVSLLRAGDIFFTSSIESRDPRVRALSQRICEAICSPFSHTLICTSPPTLAEAASDGVSSLSLVNCFAHALENIRILRHVDGGVAHRAASIAQHEIGREYSFRQAMQSLSPDPTVSARGDDNGTFCSAFVAQAFAMAGAEEFAAVSIERTTPATLSNIEGLIDVTAHIFQPKLAPRNVERMSALDGDYAPTPSSPQTAIFQRYAKLALPHADRLVSEYPEAALERQTTYFGMLKLILNADRALHRVPEARQVHFLAAIADLDKVLVEQQADGAIKEFYDELVESDSRQMQRNFEEAFSENPDIDISALQNLYETGLTSIPARQAAVTSMRAGRVRASIETYCDLQEKSLQFASQRQKAIEEILRRLGHRVPG